MEKHVCPWWLAYTFDNPLRRLLHNPEKMFSPYLKEGMTAIDIGCGMGYFSIGMARIIGASGRVVSVDLQQKMLNTLAKRADRAGVADRITTCLCDEDDIGVNDHADFALAFWMVHETPDQHRFLKQVHSILNQSGRLLIAEPKIHVSLSDFTNTLAMAAKSGFRLTSSPPISFSYSALLEKQ